MTVIPAIYIRGLKVTNHSSDYSKSTGRTVDLEMTAEEARELWSKLGYQLRKLQKEES